MKISDIIEYIERLDKSLPEFFEIYAAVSDKYWNVENPDEFQQKAIMLHNLAERGEDWHVHSIATIAEGFFNLIEEKNGMLRFHFTVEDLPVFITMCTSPTEMDEVINQIEKTIMGATAKRKPGEEMH